MVAGSNRPRVVITGVGVVSPVGVGKQAFWDNLVAGRSGIDYLRAFSASALPSKLAAEVRNFDPLDYIKQRKMLKVMSRDIQLGVSSASMAMDDAGLLRGDVDPNRLGVDFGSGHISITPSELAEAATSCVDEDRFEWTRWGEGSIGNIAPLWLLKHLPNMPACHVSIEHDARGPNNTITCREASALLALEEAVRTIERDAADVMIVGAGSSSIHPVDMARLNLTDDLSLRDDSPERAVRPFDFDRDGTIVGEGAASFIVERYEHAVARGADIYAEILSVAGGCDGFGLANHTSQGRGIVRSIEAALRKAGIRPDELGHINAHGKATQAADRIEARAYHTALGSAADSIPVTALKSYFGHFDAGSGAVELAGSILALRHGQIPMTLNYERPDPFCRLNVIHQEPQRLRSPVFMSVNRTDVGQSAATILRAI